MPYTVGPTSLRRMSRFSNTPGNGMILYPGYQSQLDSTFSSLPSLISAEGENATRRFLEFFMATGRPLETK